MSAPRPASSLKPLRLVFALEAALIAFAGVQALVDPAAAAAPFIAELPAPPAIDLMRWVGATWVLVVALEVGLLWRGTREAWRLVLVALLIGDVLHLAAHGLTIVHGGSVGVATWGSLAATTVFGICRVLAFVRPERVLRASAIRA